MMSAAPCRDEVTMLVRSRACVLGVRKSQELHSPAHPAASGGPRAEGCRDSLDAEMGNYAIHAATSSVIQCPDTMDRMSKDNTRKLRSCIDLLDLYEKPLRESLEDGEQLEDPPAVMLLRGFAFGGATLKAMIAVADQDDECGVCMPTLCRPFYELAVRVLWASRDPDGWQRLQKHCANEDRKWARRAVNLRSWAEYARRVLDNAESVLDRTDDDGNPYSNPPPMDQTLQQVEKRDIDCGLKTEEGSARFEYANLWQMMCGTAHAHLVRIAHSPEAHTLIAVNGAAVATFALLRATAVVVAPDADGIKEIVEAMGQKINGILKGETDLGLDEVTFTRVRPDPE